jgi:large subunit ribosomal protein L22
VIEGIATARYVRGSAQKAGLVMDLIRGRDVNDALARLLYSRKSVARDVSKVLRSAIANAQQKEGASGDVDRLFVGSCYANQGPSQKRVRPAPMGRAFRIIKRTSHLTVTVRERPEQAAPVVAVPASEPASHGDADAASPAKRPRRKTVAKGSSTGKTSRPKKSARSAKPTGNAAETADTTAGAAKKKSKKKTDEPAEG